MVISNIFYFIGIFFIKSCFCEILNEPLDLPVDTYVLWANATVPFYVNKDHFDTEQENIILMALENFMKKTCVKFLPVPTMPTTSQHVLLFENPNGVNRFTIPPWGHSVDEPHRVVIGYKGLKSPYIEMMIMKALGFPFEHNSGERKNYVRVQYNNIEQSYLQHFAMETATPEEFIGLYDYKSVMHFKSYQFTKNGQRTIVLKNPNITDYDTMSSLTTFDIYKIQMVYGPECLSRDRKEKIDVCQILKTGKRDKRSVNAFPRKSLRVNPDITPPPILDSSELDLLNFTEVVKEITEHIKDLSSLIVKVARAKYCNVSNNEPYYISNEKIKEAVANIEHHAKIVIEHAQMNSNDFCEEKPNLRSCSDFGNCSIANNSTKSEIYESAQSTATPNLSDVNRMSDKPRIHYPYPGLLEGQTNVTAKSNATEIKKDAMRLKREAEHEVNVLEESEEPSRRLVRKTRKKSTIPTPQATTELLTLKIVTEKETTVTEKLKPKAEEDDYEEIEIIDNASETENIQIKPTIPRQKRFKKKYVNRLPTDNKEEDMANFDQKQRPKTTENVPDINDKPNIIIKQGIKKKRKLSTPLHKKIQIDNYETYEEEGEEEATGVKNVKVIMEYNTPDTQHNPDKQDEYQEESGAEANEGVKQQIKEEAKQDEEEEESGTEANVDQQIDEEAEDKDESLQPVVIPEQQINTPSPEIFVNDFSDEEDDYPTTRKLYKLKKVSLQPPKPVKPAKTRIIGPGAAIASYPPSLPTTIRLNKKNLEFYNERKWPDAVIPFVITEYQQYDTNDLRERLNEVNRILKMKTCVQFQEVSSEDAENSFEDYLILDTSPDYVTGRVGGKQHFGSIELFEGGQHRQHAAMMIMAMLGFYFEVARHDRDNYVRVHLRHVRADKLHHFEKIRDDATFPLPYDYKSATHPAWQFWRKLGKKGISTVATYKDTDPSGTLMKNLGQNFELLSEYDIIKINTIYGVDCFMKSGLIRDD